MTWLRVLGALGACCLLVACVVPLGACGPSAPPIQETCEAAGAYSGVTSITVTSVRDSAYGWGYTEIRFSATGEILPTCAAYTLYVAGRPVESGNIPGRVSGTGGRTSFASESIIYHSPGLGSRVSPSSVQIEAFGLHSPWLGAPADAGPGDAATDAPEADDAGEEDAPEPSDAPAEIDAGMADAGEADAG